MKKRIWIFLTMALCLLMLLAGGTAEEFFELEDEGTLVSYSGNGAEVEVPAEVNGEAVRALGESLFYGHEEITSLVIPEGVISIDMGAVSRMTGLKIKRVLAKSALTTYFCDDTTFTDFYIF